MGLFCDPHQQIAGTVLRREQFGDDFDRFVDNLLKTLEQLLDQRGPMGEAKAIGIASPGLFRSDGSYLLAANVPMLTGHNLKQRLAERTGLPVAIENDANAGGLAEWSVIRTALLVLGLRRRMGRSLDRRDGNGAVSRTGLERQRPLAALHE